MKNSNSISTKKNLIKLFKRLGLNKGDNVIVHSSMKTLGTIVNGAIDVVESLIETVGKQKGTILMPSHSGQMTDPIFGKTLSYQKNIYIFIKKI
tara:strand:+ start:827 stop:1108 length:282 start_codon:yes stop_codon:yes gene_type:complete